MFALSVEVVLHVTIASYFLGWESGFHYYFLPFILFIFINHKQSLLIIVFESAVVLGVDLWLLIYSSGETELLQHNLELIKALQIMNIGVNFLAIALLGDGLRTSSMRAEREMEQLASIDMLSGLYNRRKMYELLELEQIRLQRSDKSKVIELLRKEIASSDFS
ncbi:MAG: hypothetical protein OEY36_04030 [Gammaproteobacteria bacterium]|nr:hypothetical protein [Gammaproteobacteria bacterium]